MKSKKVLLTAILSLAMGLVACGSNPGDKSVDSNHVHAWGDWVEVEKATCDKEGSKERTCTGCGQKETSKINKTSHKYADYAGDATHVPQEANCQHGGVKYQKCENCGDIKEIKTEKGDHSKGTEQAAVAGANTKSTYGVCSGCGQKRIEWSVKDYDKAISSSGLGDGAEGIKFKKVWNATKPTGGADSGTEGDSLGFTVNSPAAATKVVFSFYCTTNGNNAPLFDSVSNDNNPSYEWNGTEWVVAAKRLKLYVNDVECPFAADSYGTVDASTTDWFDFPCDVTLKAGVNKIVLQCWGGYRQTMFNYALKW